MFTLATTAAPSIVKKVTMPLQPQPPWPLALAASMLLLLLVPAVSAARGAEDGRAPPRALMPAFPNAMGATPPLCAHRCHPSCCFSFHHHHAHRRGPISFHRQPVSKRHGTHQSSSGRTPGQGHGGKTAGDWVRRNTAPHCLSWVALAMLDVSGKPCLSVT